MAAPDSRLCRYAIYESGFAAFDIALYSSQLYPEGENLSSQDNAFHAAVSFAYAKTPVQGRTSSHGARLRIFSMLF